MADTPRSAESPTVELSADAPPPPTLMAPAQQSVELDIGGESHFVSTSSAELPSPGASGPFSPSRIPRYSPSPTRPVANHSAAAAEEGGGGADGFALAGKRLAHRPEPLRLRCVGFCGVDDSVDVRLLLALSARYDWIEWGVLIRSEMQGAGELLGMLLELVVLVLVVLLLLVLLLLAVLPRDCCANPALPPSAARFASEEWLAELAALNTRRTMR